MDQIAMRGRARVPAINCENTASRARVGRHLDVLAGPAAPQGDTDSATLLMRELTTRDRQQTKPSRTARVSLFAPLRRLRRTLFGGRHRG
ncbi:hypothetical protein G5C51_33150 [Streptomyces sp. A7024]|uniref:Uncharacterized protein n=1 Tax=Streptomyces coryli TaxID=1128680 RepID=A0A6G4U910_9ACTN|nr:hypothetical protein [Streptomyces coryli]NGN68725.1 hypothetical protein [Streptomyces coryli]